MFNSVEFSSSEIQNVSCDTSFPRFIELHNQASQIPSLSYYNSTKTPPKSRLTGPIKDNTSNHEKQGLSQIPREILERKTPLVSLNLSCNKFEYFPMEILQIKTLCTLKMDHNKLKSLPLEISQLSNLEFFSFSYNSIPFLPVSMTKLTKLKELNVQSNMINTLPIDLENFKDLRNLNILHNYLDSLPTSFGKLSMLQDFCLEWFRYTDPKLPVHQRGLDGEINIKKIREKCNNLQLMNIKTLSIEGFLELFSSKKRDLSALDDFGRTIAHEACLNEDISILKYVLSRTPEIIDACDKNHLTPLCLGLLEEKHKSVHYLLKHGALVTHGGGTYGSALHIATKKMNLFVVQRIIQIGEDPNKKDIRGNTPLHYAVELMIENCTTAQLIAQYLLENKADPNIRNKENWTPLHVVARKKDGKVLDWILSYNFEAEEIHGDEEVFKLNKGGGSFNWTAMHISAYVGAPALVLKLGEAGVDMFKKSVNGYTPKKVVNRNGVNLKLLEKYEKEWISRNILHKAEIHPESLASLNLMRFNDGKGVPNASKNKFEGATLSLNNQQDNNLLAIMVKNRVRMIAPLLGCGPMSKRQDYDDSFELSPESEASFEDEKETNEESEDLIDFNSELNEGVTIEVNPYSKEVPLAQNKKEIAVKTNQASQKYFREKENMGYQQIIDIDNDTYEARLRKNTNFDINFIQTELRFFKDSLMLPKVSFIEKMKVITGIKILHKVIIEYIYKDFHVKTSQDLIPYVIVGRNKAQGKGRISDNTITIINFYELVPQCLMSCFVSLSIQDFENVLIKRHILCMLTDMKYYPALDFFQNTISNPLEVLSVKIEARKSYNCLMASLNYAERNA